MSFHDVRFPVAISRGATGGPERRTEIVSLASGFEERNASWAHSRRKYNAGFGIKSVNDLHAIVEFFEARMGRLHAFRWKDWSDFKSTAPLGETGVFDQEIGIGDGITSEFQLTKQYVSGSQTCSRMIAKPVEGTVRIAVGGAELSEGSDFAADAATGMVTLSQTPGPGLAVTAGFEFDVPVRFDTDFLELNLSRFKAGEIANIPLIEVRI